MGTDDGVGMGLPVVTTDGLIGCTVEVSAGTCEVLLITDPTCRVSGRFPRTDALGIVRGTGGTVLGDGPGLEMLWGVNPCRMDYITPDQIVGEGDVVLTSGLGGVYPEGLVIGRVTKVYMDVSGLYQRADVATAATVGLLKYAFVILPADVADAGQERVARDDGTVTNAVPAP